MDEREEEGVRAFALRVGARAGASYPEDPIWVERAGARIDVAEVEARWREVERLGYRVRLADGARLLLYYVPELDLWSGVAFAEDADANPIRRVRS
jgi:hypothetical protein